MRERTRKLALTQDAIIQSLAALAETRHHETGGHIQRTRHYVRALAMRLREHPGSGITSTTPRWTCSSAWRLSTTSGRWGCATASC